MTAWTAHRFSGGALALDLVNTVIWKDTEDRAFDRLKQADDASAFALAAMRHSKDMKSALPLLPPQTQAEMTELLDLRDAIDNWLRPVAKGQHNVSAVAPLFKACWTATMASDSSRLAFACVASATQFFQLDMQTRVKICPACRWLFLDRSKNKSRRWCDMKVCGNRAKVQQHYHVRKQRAEVEPC